MSICDQSSVSSLFCSLSSARAQADESPRKLYSLSGHGWEFLGGKDKDILPEIGYSAFNSARWTKISIPYTFQSRTGMETAQVWYRTRITVPASYARSEFFRKMLIGVVVVP